MQVGLSRWEISEQRSLSDTDIDSTPQLTLPRQRTVPGTANSHVDFEQATCKQWDE
jgi:hypothetical protein